MSDFRRTATVTGAGSGIARAVALALGDDGFSVALLDRDAEAAEAVADSLRSAGAAARAFRVDVADRTLVTQAFAEAQAWQGPAGVLVHVAGFGAFAPFLEMTAEQWSEMMRVHLDGTFHCTQEAARPMVEAGWGRIVTTASVAGMSGGGPGLAHYAAAKGGIIGLTKALAHELGPTGVTVNCVAPGLVDTPGLRRSGVSDEILAYTKKGTPTRRVGEPADIAAAARYIVSEGAGFLTGQIVSPNGGAYM